MPEHETIALSDECSATLQHKLPSKLKDPMSFTLPYSRENLHNINVQIDSGASINLMILSIHRKIVSEDLKEISITLMLVDKLIKHPYEVVEHMLIKVGYFIFSAIPLSMIY